MCKGTDDLRESPIIALAERLIGRGYELTIYDPSVELARLTGSNRDYILAEIPHFENLLRSSAQEAICNAEIIVIGHNLDEAVEEIIHYRPNVPIIDLVGVEAIKELYAAKYFGICW